MNNKDKDKDEREASIFTYDYENKSLSSLLNSHHTAFMDKIHALRIINHLSHNMLEDYLSLVKEKFKQKVAATLNEEERIEYDFTLSLEIVAPTGPRLEDKIKHPKVAKIFEDEKEMYHNREDIRRASKEMTLVYLVIIFGEFLTNLLSALLRKRSEPLELSKKYVAYEEVLKHTTLYELVTSMSKKEGKAIVELSIEDLNESLNRRFKLNLGRRDDWTKFKEFFYRHNIVVHNYGIPDSTYINKTKFKSEKNYWLEIDNQYINEAFDIFESYSNEIANFFFEKYCSRSK